MRTLWIAPIAVFASLTLACSNSSTAAQDCQAAFIRIEGECSKLCTNDNACDAGTICTGGGVCQTGTRTTAPAIDTVNGTGSADGADGNSDNHFEDSLIITGVNLEGASDKNSLLDGSRVTRQVLGVNGKEGTDTITIQQLGERDPKIWRAGRRWAFGG